MQVVCPASRFMRTNPFKCNHVPFCRRFTVLALESSADDTCASVVTSEGQILSNIVIKQHSLHVSHEKFGGIYPPEAIAAHRPIAIQKSLADAGLRAVDVDGLAYTRGPGMRGCLNVNCNAAQSIAAALNKPVVGVHHMQAHALTPFLSSPPSERPVFPFLALLVSGGHTLLLLARSHSNFSQLATTPDMSIGNAYDKVSRLLNIHWDTLGPGAALEKFCLDHPDSSLEDGFPAPQLTFPVPSKGNFMFSYSGMYSAVQRYCEALSLDELTVQRKARIAWAFQRAAIGHLENTLRTGLNWCDRHGIEIQHVVVSGGVASNLFLRERLRACVQESPVSQEVTFIFPPVFLCTDNAAMIGWASMDRFLRNDHDTYDMDILPSWNIEDLKL
ncbi:glycoprotease family-domain-containing protein [Hysterangium stoloniferum]|nr:glycoprotease family-domain-containing protein [Hysterangium stoloniferum]